MTAFESALAHYDRGQLREALPLFQRALVEQPGDVEVMYRTALTLVAMRKYAECAYWLEQFLPHVNVAETAPWLMAGFYYNLGIAHEAAGNWAAGERCHRSALAFDPNAVLPKIEIGSNRYRQGDPDDGKRWHDLALAIDEVDVECRPAHSFLRLLRGDYLKGFAEYEGRWKLPQVLAHAYVPPNCWRWKGKPLDGKRILVVGEQGIGDTILMSRYVPLIEARGGKVVLVCNPTLRQLFVDNFPHAQVFGFGEKHPECRWWVPMMSMPFVFGTTKETVPPISITDGTTRSTSATVTTLNRLWHRQYPSAVGPRRIGYVSSGNPLFMGDKDRSAPPGAFAPLLELPGYEWIDLSEAADRARGNTDFAETATLVAGLDLVITVDTAIGHLAGGLGVPTWLLPMTSLHWLWGMHEPGSVWYPNHRLWWRPSVDTWPEVIERMRKELIAGTFIRETRI